MNARPIAMGFGTLLLTTAIALSAATLYLVLDLSNTAALLLALSLALGMAGVFALRASQLKALNRALGTVEDTNRRFEAALSNMPLGLVMFDASERIVVCNDRYIDMYGLSRDVAKPGCDFLKFLEHRAQHGHPISDPEGFRRDLLTRLSLGKTINRIMRTADGREISIVNRPMPGGGWIATHEDITEQREAQAKISHMALHDALTNLPNRLHFRQELESRFSRLQDGQKFAVLCFDLDRFKGVNDCLGHASGDKLLQMAAERMRNCLCDGDTLARLGGDEFAILQAKAEPEEAVSALAAKLNDVIAAPFDLDGHQAVIGVSIGIAVAPSDAAGPDELMRNADVALYQAKAGGRGSYRRFAPEMTGLMESQRQLEFDLRKALINGEFELHYQPLINLQAGAVCGCEALLRWNHPTRGLIPPLQFIPLAEETGLIVPIGEWVIREACREAANWPSHVAIAVNLSSSQFKGRNLVESVIGALAQSGLPAQRLELEITESVLLLDDEKTLATLRQLRHIGVRIAMDDFGTGQSSFSNLRCFPFDKIKIDRSFVHGLAANEQSKAIIRAVTALGSSLGITTTGEGVETEEELDFLKAADCTEAQGFLFSRPARASEIRAMLGQDLLARRAVA